MDAAPRKYLEAGHDTNLILDLRIFYDFLILITEGREKADLNTPLDNHQDKYIYTGIKAVIVPDLIKDSHVDAAAVHG